MVWEGAQKFFSRMFILPWERFNPTQKPLEVGVCNAKTALDFGTKNLSYHVGSSLKGLGTRPMSLFLISY